MIRGIRNPERFKILRVNELQWNGLLQPLLVLKSYTDLPHPLVCKRISEYAQTFPDLFFIDYIHRHKETKQGQPTTTPDWLPEDESM